MKINYGFLADYASLSREGKLSIMGIFSRIGVPELPATHPQAYIAFEVEMHYGEVGEAFELRVEIRDPEGAVLFERKGRMQAKGDVRPGDIPRIQQILPVQNLELQREGRHDVNFYIQGEMKRAVSFEVQVVSQPEQSQS